MEQKTAHVLFEEGAMLVFLDMPEGSEFGMDFNSWNVGPAFRGMKMIPPGVHFVYYSAVGRDKQSSPRSGFFHNFSKQEILVKKWDVDLEDGYPLYQPQNTDQTGVRFLFRAGTCRVNIRNSSFTIGNATGHNNIKMEPVSQDALMRFEENKKDLDRFLAPYPYESYKKWVSLSNQITPQIALDLQPECGSVCAATQFVSEASTSQSRKRDAETEVMEDNSRSHGEDNSRSQLPEDKLPNLKAVQGTQIRYTQIPKMKYPTGASPAEVTKFSIDSSFQLETVIKQRYAQNPAGFLGEVQFAFLCFLIGQNYDSFDHWKWLVHILCTSDEMLHAHPKLFNDFIGVLHFQIREIPEDFFVDIVSANNFLTTTLHELFSNLEEPGVEATLRSRGLKFRQHLTDKFNWDFTSEPDEYAPVVVETTE